MERLNQLLARLGDTENPLTAEELTELSTLVDEQRTSIAAVLAEDPSPENVALANEIADAREAVAAENTTREQAAAEQRAAADEAIARLTPAEPEPVVDETPVETEQVPEPVAASATPRRVRLSAVAPHRPAEREPREPEQDRQVPLTASAQAGGGTVISAESFAQGLERVVRAVKSTPNGLQGEQVVVASADWRSQYGEDRRLTDAVDGGSSNTTRRDAALRAHQAGLRSLMASGNTRGLVAAASGDLSALTAAGGICAPVAVDYSIPVIGSADRPVKAALPAFGADRGGVRFVDPTGFTISALTSGVAIWTEANDRSPGSANTGPGGTGTGPSTKPSIEINCGSEIQVLVEAITQQITIGNMRARFNPEQVAAALSYLDIAHARVAENELLRQLIAGSIAVTSAQRYGATRDILSVVDLMTAGYRDRYRLAPGITLRAIFPHWVKDMMRVDLARAAFPFEGDLPGTSLGISDEQIMAWFAARNIMATFTLDYMNADQAFGTQNAGAINVFPSTVRWLLFAEGTFQFLDGGQLDLGVVRDSSLNAVNKFQIFSETFEAVAKRGFESDYITSTVLANGAASGSVTPVGTF